MYTDTIYWLLYLFFSAVTQNHMEVTSVIGSNAILPCTVDYIGTQQVLLVFKFCDFWLVHFNIYLFHWVVFIVSHFSYWSVIYIHVQWTIFHPFHWSLYLYNHLVNLSVCPSIWLSIDVEVSQVTLGLSVGWSINHWVSCLICPLVKSFSQSVSQLANQSASQSVSQSVTFD